MNYASDGDSMMVAAQLDSLFANFFASVGIHVRELNEITKQCGELQNAASLNSMKLKGVLQEQKWSGTDSTFHDKITECQSQVQIRK